MVLGFPRQFSRVSNNSNGKLAGSVLPAGLAPDQHQLATMIIAGAFVAGYRRAMILTAAIAFASAMLAAKRLAEGPLR